MHKKYIHGRVPDYYQVVIEDIFSSLEIDEEMIYNRAYHEKLTEDFITIWEHALNEFVKIETIYWESNDELYKIECRNRLEKLYGLYRSYIQTYFSLPDVKINENTPKNKKISKEYKMLTGKITIFYYDYISAFYDVADKLRFKLAYKTSITPKGHDTLQQEYKEKDDRAITKIKSNIKNHNYPTSIEELSDDVKEYFLLSDKFSDISTVLNEKIKPMVIATKNKANWDYVCFAFKLLNIVDRKLSRKKFANLIVAMCPGLDEASKLNSSMEHSGANYIGKINDYDNLSDTNSLKSNARYYVEALKSVI